VQLCSGIGRKQIERVDGDMKMVWFVKLVLSLVFGKLIGKALDKLIR
jgi:hypothetical protein